jgi:hypothetical protein
VFQSTIFGGRARGEGGRRCVLKTPKRTFKTTFKKYFKRREHVQRDNNIFVNN